MTETYDVDYSVSVDTENPSLTGFDYSKVDDVEDLRDSVFYNKRDDRDRVMKETPKKHPYQSSFPYTVQKTFEEHVKPSIEPDVQPYRYIHVSPYSGDASS